MASCNEIHQLLPEDVIIEILSWLPVKSVIRARAVCKNWNTITKNPSFVTKHFKHHTNNSGHLFVMRFDEISSRFVLSLFPDETLAGSPQVYEDVVVDMIYHVQFAASPYNGILCLTNRSQRLALWNPATREFRSLPKLPPRDLPPYVQVGYQNTFGFGLDPITNDYKVVCIWYDVHYVDAATYEPEETGYGPWQVAVYTLSTDSWRYLDVALPYTLIEGPVSNTCINGVYHWFAIDNDDHRLILSFDLGNELFSEIRDTPTPRDHRSILLFDLGHDLFSEIRDTSTPSAKHGYYAILAPYNNSLALIYHDSDQVVDVWVMMEEGGWTNQFTVQLSEQIRPLGFWKNSQLFMETDDRVHVFLYDLETQEIKDLESPIWEYYLVYKESLVAISRGDGFLEEDQLSDVDRVQKFSIGWFE
ncbi:F-box/LRR-repeat/kelch-repeat protein At1g09650-like [Cornus florida]|uniref:F-box/LRR-repeat/kelch-repeat protein At1g09650-like n=1 Tax=Cornus florida TaxID=4283 RepID=UPI002896754A|nr:F-box/LRR-repeat/kelch-repeat protein At1g09650-like [Cornus florida]